MRPKAPSTPSPAPSQQGDTTRQPSFRESRPQSFVFEGHALRTRLRSEILEIELHRSPCNEIGLDLLVELEGIASWIESGAHGARALLLHSSVEKGFCAGADLKALYQGILSYEQNTAPDLLLENMRSFLIRIHKVFRTLDTCPIPVIAAIHGFCFGGGWELMLTCDVVVADRSARFCFPELRLGLIPGFGGIPRLKRELPNAVIRDLLLSGRSLGAKRAYELGLIAQLVAKDSALDVARKVAEQTTLFDRTTTQSAKAFIKPSLDLDLEREVQHFLSLFQSPVVKEALGKFVHSNDARPYLPSQ